MRGTLYSDLVPIDQAIYLGVPHLTGRSMNYVRFPVIVLLTLSTLGIGPAHADDPSIPARCRPKLAMDDPKCMEVLTARYLDRNARLNKRDAQANAELKERILASQTMGGGTVASSLEYAAKHIPFTVTGWDFVYARSGAEYVVASYGAKRETRQSPRDHQLENALLFDYDIETDPVASLQNSRAVGLLVWKVDGKVLLPWGSNANMLSLTPATFVHAVNAEREGFRDSGYDAAVDRDYSFLSGLGEDGPRLAASPAASDPAAKFYWNVVDGFVLQSDKGPCPVATVGMFKLRGANCETKAAAAREVPGTVLPFKVIRAIRNHGFTGGMVAADISVSVEGGSPGDWMATAVYIAEHAIVGDVTFSQVAVFVPNQWADFPPQQAKLLSKVYYAPVPARSPWKEQWTIMGAARAGTAADVEYDRLSNDLIEDPSKVPDPERRLTRAAAAARAAVVRKYSLPAKWVPTERLGLDGQVHDREAIRIATGSGVEASMSALGECLTTGRGNALFQGCMPPRP